MKRNPKIKGGKTYLTLFRTETGAWAFGLRTRTGAFVGIFGKGKTPLDAKTDYERRTHLASINQPSCNEQ